MNERRMSIPEFLDTLDYDQLKTARSRIEQRIAEKEAENKVGMWSVRELSFRIACYPEDQYAQAVERLCSEIRREAKRNPQSPVEMTLAYERVRESEVGDYLALGH